MEDFFLNNPKQNFNKTVLYEAIINTSLWSLVHLSYGVLFYGESNFGGGLKK